MQDALPDTLLDALNRYHQHCHLCLRFHEECYSLWSAALVLDPSAADTDAPFILSTWEKCLPLAVEHDASGKEWADPEASNDVRRDLCAARADMPDFVADGMLHNSAHEFAFHCGTLASNFMQRLRPSTEGMGRANLCAYVRDIARNDGTPLFEGCAVDQSMVAVRLNQEGVKAAALIRIELSSAKSAENTTRHDTAHDTEEKKKKRPYGKDELRCVELYKSRRSKDSTITMTEITEEVAKECGKEAGSLMRNLNDHSEHWKTADDAPNTTRHDTGKKRIS